MDCRIRAFTLIELLLTVSIIAMLAGLIVPAAGRSMRYARMAGCTGILRQLGIAESAYTERSDGFILPAQANELRWYHLLEPDVASICSRRDRDAENREVCAVPLCPENSFEEGRPVRIGTFNSFTPWNDAGETVTDMGGYGRWIFYGGSWQGGRTIFPARRMGRLRRPSMKISLLESYSSLLYTDAMFDNAPALGATAWTRHRRELVQVLHGDGHTGTMKRCRLADPDEDGTVKSTRFEP